MRSLDYECGRCIQGCNERIAPVASARGKTCGLCNFPRGTPAPSPLPEQGAEGYDDRQHSDGKMLHVDISFFVL